MNNIFSNNTTVLEWGKIKHGVWSFVLRTPYKRSSELIAYPP